MLTMRVCQGKPLGGKIHGLSVEAFVEMEIL
jgi:hypothetical protein